MIINSLYYFCASFFHWFKCTVNILHSVCVCWQCGLCVTIHHRFTLYCDWWCIYVSFWIQSILRIPNRICQCPRADEQESSWIQCSAKQNVSNLDQCCYHSPSLWWPSGVCRNHWDHWLRAKGKVSTFNRRGLEIEEMSFDPTGLPGTTLHQEILSLM